jgi:hypothetical protein
MRATPSFTSRTSPTSSTFSSSLYCSISRSSTSLISLGIGRWHIYSELGRCARSWHEPGRRGERELHGLPAQQLERRVALALDVGPGALDDALCLRTRLLLHLPAHALGRRPALGDELARLPARVGELLTVLLEQLGRLRVVRRSLVELCLDSLLALLDHVQDRPPGELAQDGHQDREHDERPDAEARVDVVEASATLTAPLRPRRSGREGEKAERGRRDATRSHDTAPPSG